MKKDKSLALFKAVQALIKDAQLHIVRNVNTTMLLTYFEIGRMIAEEQKQGNPRAKYADETIKKLSAGLTKEFGKGYSKSNLEYMVNFFKIYASRITPIAQLAIGQSKITAKQQLPNQRLGNLKKENFLLN